MELFVDWPFPAAAAALFAIVMARANATYWAGRAVRAGVGRARRRHTSPVLLRRAEELINRWGPPAVTLSFLTIGVQTAINFTAGTTRMPLRRYLPAVTVGGLIWALLYASVGVLTVEGLATLYDHARPVFWVVAIGGPLAIAGFVVRAVRQRRDDVVVAEPVATTDGVDPGTTTSTGDRS